MPSAIPSQTARAAPPEPPFAIIYLRELGLIPIIVVFVVTAPQMHSERIKNSRSILVMINCSDALCEAGGEAEFHLEFHAFEFRL